jgi:hypothetical protein
MADERLATLERILDGFNVHDLDAIMSHFAPGRSVFGSGCSRVDALAEVPPNALLRLLGRRLRAGFTGGRSG